MKFFAASLLLFVCVGEGLVPWFFGWIRVSGLSSEQAAPDCEEDIALKPCHCLSFGFLICPDIDNELQLVSPLARTRESYPQLDTFELDTSVLRFLPAEIFKGQKFKLIKIFQSTLTALTDSDIAFVGLEHEVENLIFMDVVLQSDWDWSIFRKLSSVKQMLVDGWSIDYLDKIPDDNLMSLQDVEFRNNKMTELHPEVFQKFQNLVLLHLDHNQINSIERTMLPRPASDLKTLDLGYNEIEFLPDDMFTDMPALDQITLQDNKLLTLSEETFKPLLKKKTSRLYDTLVNLANNDIECDCRLLWVVNIYQKHGLVLGGTCSTPPWLQGRLLPLLRSEDLHC